MKALRVLVLILAAFAAPLTVFGFWADHSLDDSAGYADAMVDAWQDPSLRHEVNAQVTELATNKINDYFNVSGSGENVTADLALNFATSTIDRTLASAPFVAAWQQWHLQLHDDLALIARGGTPETTSVDGHSVTVDVEPLIASFFDNFVGRLALQALDQNALTLRIETVSNTEAQLASLGWLAAQRWWFAAGFAGAALVALLVWSNRLRGVAHVLLAGAVGCSIAIFVPWIYSAVTTQEETALGSAISAAMSRGSALWPLLAAVVLGLAGLVLRRQSASTGPRSALSAETA